MRTEPQTYETILKEQYDNRNTVTNWLRNQFSNLIKYRFIYSGILLGTRFGKRIFFHPEKEYYIVIARIKGKFYYYFCGDMLELNDEHLTLKNCSILNIYNWDFLGDITMSRGDMIKWL